MTQECMYAHYSACPLEVCNCRRASTTPPWEKSHADTSKLWKDMTPEEKGALLLARHENQPVELQEGNCWFWVSDPAFYDYAAYRIKPEPKRETVVLYAAPINGNWNQRRIGTIDLIDGKPDPASIKIEEQGQ